ncbi:MAG: hypothetical protein QOG49_1098, partial [Frankiaceae bacterium]|nr:hypothetical protein [Frankiaceae bacterium]
DRGTYAFARPVTVLTAAIAIVGGAYVCQKMTRQQVDRNAAVVAVRDWAATIPPAQSIALNAPEGAERLGQILNFHGTPRPIGYVADDNAAARPMYYVFFHDQSNGNPRLRKTVVRRLAMATVYATDLPSPDASPGVTP